MKRILIILIAFTIISCSEKPEKNILSPTPPQTPSPQISKVAKDYLNEVLDIMQKYSINKYKIDWTALRSETFKKAGDAQTTQDTYMAIRQAIKMLNDNHSYFLLPVNRTVHETEVEKQNQINKFLKTSAFLYGCRLNNRIGFIRVPAFVSTQQDEGNKLVNDLQSESRRADSTTVKAWIVDLRNNSGGNMWPMLAGVGPVLGNGLAGKFMTPDSIFTNWSYIDGMSIYRNNYVNFLLDFYTLKNQNPFVAVLTNGYTGSSGEAIVIAFKGRDKTKSFGTRTAGASTAISTFLLKDGATLGLAIAYMVDRNGVVYGNKIEPDEYVEGTFKYDPRDNDEVVNVAVKWLESMIK